MYQMILYIDPGTGSMLFSILIGAIATLYFLLKAAIIKIKFVISGKRGLQAAETAHPFVIYCEGRQYCNLFVPIVQEFEQRKIPLVYYTSAQDDPLLSAENKYVAAAYIGSGNAAFARLNLLEADVVLMTTPGLQVYQLKRSKKVRHYAHILHAASDATMYRLFGIDYYDSVLLTGGYQKHDIRELETQRGLPHKELVTVGCPYLDTLAQKLRDIPEETQHPFTVLVSPSWGASAILAKYGEKLLDPLAQTGWRIIIRPHPQSKKSEAALLGRLTERYRQNSSVEWDYSADNIYAMKKSDVMISDFSGIIFDYAFLCDKPVLYVSQDIDLRPYDADDLDHEIWQFTTLRKIGRELKEDQFDAIQQVIHTAADSTEMQLAREQAKEEAWQHIGQGAARTVDFLVQKQQEFSAP